MDLFAKTLEEVLPEQPVEHVILTSLGDMMPFPKRLIVNAVVRYLKKMVPAYNLPKVTRFSDALKAGASVAPL